MLLLDEPLSALDAKIRVALRKEIRAIQRQLGITTIYVTHDQEEALSISDRIVVMSEGRIEQIGTPSEIYNFPATPFVASFVGTLNLLPGDGRRRRGRPADDRRPGDPRRAARRRGAGQRVTVALRPEAVELGETRRQQPPARHRRGRELPGLDRADPGQGRRPGPCPSTSSTIRA